MLVRVLSWFPPFIRRLCFLWGWSRAPGPLQRQPLHKLPGCPPRCISGQVPVQIGCRVVVECGLIMFDLTELAWGLASVFFETPPLADTIGQTASANINADPTRHRTTHLGDVVLGDCLCLSGIHIATWFTCLGEAWSIQWQREGEGDDVRRFRCDHQFDSERGLFGLRQHSLSMPFDQELHVVTSTTQAADMAGAVQRPGHPNVWWVGECCWYWCFTNSKGLGTDCRSEVGRQRVPYSLCWHFRRICFGTSDREESSLNNLFCFWVR